MANTLTFASQTITDAHIFGGVSFLIDLNAGDEFTIGNTASASVSFVTDIQVPLYSKDGTNGVFTWEQDSVSRGTFYVTEVTKANGMYTVTAYDAMYLTEKNISVLSLTLPISVSNCASAIATYIGCTVSGTIKNGSLTATELVEDMTVRDLLGRVAEASGCSVKIDSDDHLCFMYYEDSEITVTASEYISLEVADYTCAAIDNVTIINSEGEIQASAGSGTNSLYIGQNPFMESATNTNATNIYNAVKDFEYAPLTCSMFEENGIEVGTIVTFGTTPTLVMHLESGADGTTASSVGSDTRADYNKDIMTTINETRAIAIDAQTVAGQAQTAAAAAATAAGQAQASAESAQTSAQSALSQATQAYNKAVEVNTLAQEAKDDAEQAQESASIAYGSAQASLYQLSLVEDVIGTLNWISQHGFYTACTEIEVIEGKTYYTLIGTAITNPTGNPHNNGYYESVSGKYVLSEDTVVDSQKTYYQVTALQVVEPSGNPSTIPYYELQIDEAVTQYINTHLSLTNQGLSVTDGSQSSMLISSNGVTIYGSTGQIVGQYGEGAIIGNVYGYHIEMSGTRLSFMNGTGASATEIAYMSENELYIPRVVVVDSMKIGKWLWDAKTAQNHLTLKWEG